MSLGRILTGGRNDPASPLWMSGLSLAWPGRGETNFEPGNCWQPIRHSAGPAAPISLAEPAAAEASDWLRSMVELEVADGSGRRRCFLAPVFGAASRAYVWAYCTQWLRYGVCDK